MEGGAVSEERLAERLADVAVKLAAQPDLTATLRSTCMHAMRSVAADGAGILLRRHGKVGVAAAATKATAEAETMQMEIGEGPCLSSATDAESFLIPDMAREERWPTWADRMIELGWHACLAVPLRDSARRTIGSLNILGRRAGQFDEHDLEVVEIFARHASLAIIAARDGDSLHEAIDARHTIGIAQGVLIHRFGWSVDVAFERLRRHSQEHNVKLSRVAEYVIEHAELPAADWQPTSEASAAGAPSAPAAPTR